MSNESRRNRRNEKAAEQDIIIGKVVSVNVSRRELRIVPETSHPERFQGMNELRLKTRQGKTIRMALAGVRIAERTVVAKVETDDEEQIASVRGAFVMVARSERFSLPEDEYYVDDLVGLTVKDKDGSVIGSVNEVWETPANDIYQVLRGGGEEILLPAIEDVILKVDIDRGEMTVDISNLV